MNFHFPLMSAELVLAGGIVALLLLDLFGVDDKKVPGIAFTALMTGLLGYALLDGSSGSLLAGTYVSDGLSRFSEAVIFLTAALTGLVSLGSLKGSGKFAGAYYTLLAASTLGLCLLVSSKELVTLYIGLELATTSLYALAAFYKNDNLSAEAGLKYLVLGAASSAMLLYGLSLIYGFAGTTYTDVITICAAGHSSPALAAGMVLALLGVCFKLSVVPMHIWTPDVYQGAPTPVAAFISVASKAAGFVFAIRLFPLMLAGLAGLWAPLLSVLALVTMTAGNLMAIPQRNIKRFLAYSTISQAGYILVGFVAASPAGVSSVLFYLTAYAVSNMAAFAVAAAFERAAGSDDLEDYNGLARRQPLLALAFLTALLSLAGIPPLAGFVGKFYLFYAAMQRGYTWLVIAAALNSTVSLYYYLLVLKRMYILENEKEMPEINLPWSIKAALLFCVAAMLALGLFPGAVINAAAAVGAGLFQH